MTRLLFIDLNCSNVQNLQPCVCIYSVVLHTEGIWYNHQNTTTTLHPVMHVATPPYSSTSVCFSVLDRYVLINMILSVLGTFQVPSQITRNLLTGRTMLGPLLISSLHHKNNPCLIFFSVLSHSQGSLGIFSPDKAVSPTFHPSIHTSTQSILSSIPPPLPVGQMRNGPGCRWSRNQAWFCSLVFPCGVCFSSGSISGTWE